MSKLCDSAADILRDVLADGMTLAVGGFVKSAIAPAGVGKPYP